MITQCDDPNLTKWWTGGSLIEMLDKLRSPPRILNKPSRVSVVEYSSRDKGTLIGDCVFAKVEAGMI